VIIRRLSWVGSAESLASVGPLDQKPNAWKKDRILAVVCCTVGCKSATDVPNVVIAKAADTGEGLWQ